MSALKRSVHGEAFDADRMALAQVGWIGQTGEVYALTDPPRDGRERGGYAPLYIQIGTYVIDDDGRKWLSE